MKAPATRRFRLATESSISGRDMVSGHMCAPDGARKSGSHKIKGPAENEEAIADGED